MQVRIGVVHSPREMEIDVADDAVQQATAEIEKVLGGGASPLWLTDRRGRRVGVMADKITYVEIGSDAEDRRVGFSAL